MFLIRLMQYNLLIFHRLIGKKKLNLITGELMEAI